MSRGCEGGCLKGLGRLYGECGEAVWRVWDECLECVGRLPAGCWEDVWKVWGG